MSESSKSSTPFDWLQGGIFFGGGKQQKGGIESIDGEKDVMSLLNGIADNLEEILSAPTLTPPATEEGAAAAAGVAGLESKQEAAGDATTSNDEPTPSQFLAARLSRLRFLLYDERRMTSQQESRSSRTPSVATTTQQGLTSPELHELMPRLLENLAALPFESRKHVAAIFNYLLVCGLDGADSHMYESSMKLFCDYVEQHYDRLMTVIVRGHDITAKNPGEVSASTSTAPDVGLHFGSMYRACLRHASLYRLLVGTSGNAEAYVYPFLDLYVHVPNFEMSSDAMESLKAVMSANKEKVTSDHEQTAAEMAQVAADFLTRDYEDVWDKRFNPKLLSDTANYMTRRMALQILSGVLLTRSNYQVMIRYVASRDNLIQVMKLLRDTSPHITLDAFHVFKVFVANPNKPPEIEKILRDNKVKLCKYLKTLHHEKEAVDTQFRDEKALIIQTIEAL
jgi:calcium binding protein 39